MVCADADAQTAQTQDGPWIWAAPTLYGFEGGTCNPSKPEATDRGAVVDPLFCPSFGPERRSIWGKRFADAVMRDFPHVEAQFGAHLPADATPSARLRSTLAASLRLSRATYATVPKPIGIDAYLPVTLTLDITNPATGEVVFTRTRTAVAQGTYTEASLRPELSREFEAHFGAAINELVSEAAAAFRPYKQQAEVLGAVSLGDGGEGYVINAGRKQGMRTGDSIGEDSTVLHAGADYAVIRPALGKLEKGQVVTRVAAAPVEWLARPSVLSVVEERPKGFSFDWLTAVFTDALGEKSALAPVPVNRAFFYLRTFALSEAAAGNLPLNKRSLPEFVAQVRVVLLEPASWPGEVPGVTVERHEALAFVTLTDASGRAVGGWQGRGLIEDKVTGDIRLPEWQRREAVVRNALADAASRMAGFRPVPHTLPISKAGAQAFIADPGGLVPMGLTLQVMRPSGRFGGLKDEVLVPIGMVNTTAATDGGILATDAGVLALSLRKHDQVLLETSGNAITTRKVLAHCTGDDGLPAVDDRGPTPMQVFGPAADAVIAASTSAALRLSPLAGKGAEYAASFAEWASYRAAAPVQPDACFLPVVSVAPEDGAYRIATGFSLHRGASASGEKIGSSGLQSNLTPSRMPAGSTAAAIEAALQSDLAAEVLPISGKAASALKFAN